MSLPKVSRAWQFSSAKGGMEKNLKLTQTTPPFRKPDQHLVKVLAVGLNPIDHKPAELPLFTTLVLKTPATPALDYAGRIVQPADGSSLKPGQMVFGRSDTHIAGGALAEYTVSASKSVAPVPEGVSAVNAASAPICGLTAYQAIVPFIKPGSSVFINGGSGGTGVFAIQTAKSAGAAHIITTCSTANVELCKSLGADEVIDYRKSNVLQSLIASGRKYDHVVDNVGADSELYFKAHLYTNPDTTFVNVGSPPTLQTLWNIITMNLWPALLGGGQRKLVMMMADHNTKDLSSIAEWIRQGQIKPVIDTVYAFEDAPKAYEKLKTFRAKGKLVVKVADDA